MISFAYCDDIQDWESQGKTATSLDFIASNIGDIGIKKFRKLERIRCARCDKMTTFVIEDCCNLNAIDLSLSQGLRNVTIKNCKKLRALDLSFCTSLEALTGDFRSLEYLSMPYTLITHLPPMPKLKYIDVSSGTSDTTIMPSMFPSIEVFLGFQRDGVKFSEITSVKSLRFFECKHTLLNVDSKCKHSRLEFLSLPSSSYTGNAELLKGIVLETSSFNDDKIECSKYAPFEYQKANKLLYGPWGVPPIDADPVPLPPPVFELPRRDKLSDITDGILGALMGNAFGDAVGVGAEFVNKLTSHIYSIGNLSITWSHPRVTMHTASFVRGTSTDDTSQAILIMRMFVQSGGNVNQTLLASELLDWMNHGHIEHKHGNGLGAGRTTRRVLSHPCYLTDPEKASYEVWKDGNFTVAANGAVMRTSPCGCMKFWDEEFVIASATKCARVTHASPLCVYSSVAISLLVSRILQARAGLIEGYDIDDTLNAAAESTDGLDKYMDEVKQWSSAKDVAELKLGDAQGMGYTMRTYGAAIWALRWCKSFEEAIIAVYREGGDVDTNLAVVGAVMGAKYGYQAIPQDEIDYMFEKDWLLREIRQFTALMGIVI